MHGAIGRYHPTACHPVPGTLLLVDIDVDYDAVMPETRKTFGDVSVWPSGDLVATVEIGRPPDNFFDAELISSLADAFAWLDRQPEFRAAVLCSDGKHFCAGADFTGRSGRTGTGGAKELYAAAARLFEVRTPVVVAAVIARPEQQMADFVRHRAAKQIAFICAAAASQRSDAIGEHGGERAGLAIDVDGGCGEFMAPPVARWLTRSCPPVWHSDRRFFR